MAGERVVKVRLVAETAEYLVAMKKAAKHARKLKKAIRDLAEVSIRIRVERD